MCCCHSFFLLSEVHCPRVSNETVPKHQHILVAITSEIHFHIRNFLHCLKPIIVLWKSFVFWIGIIGTHKIVHKDILMWYLFQFFSFLYSVNIVRSLYRLINCSTLSEFEILAYWCKVLDVAIDSTSVIY